MQKLKSIVFVAGVMLLIYSCRKAQIDGLGGSMLNIVVCGEMLRWSSNEIEKEIAFEHRIRKCLELSDSTGMAIIFEYTNVWVKNTAIIMNLDGSIRKKVLIPPEITSFPFMMFTMNLII